MRYGHQVKFFENLITDGNPVPALDTRPELYSDLIWQWEAYCMLDNCRSMGFSGPDPIKYSEIQAMANEFELTTDQRLRFFKRIKFLDQVYFKFINEKKDK